MADEKQEVERYLRRADRYFRNAEDLLTKAEADKAGECLWGAVALTLKAVALSRTGRRLRSHQNLRAFAEELSKFQRDPALTTYFDSGEVLHRNFYEGDYTLEDVSHRLEILRPFLHRLFRLAKPSL